MIDARISRFGLVEHASKTVISIINKEDKISLIEFNVSPKIRLEATDTDDIFLQS